MEPKHVKEAFRLLNTSIIRVETPDINFEEPPPGMISQSVHSQLEDVAGLVLADESSTTEAPPTPAPPTKPARITYEEYKTIANMLIWQLQQSEEEGSTMRRSEVINWYIKEIEGKKLCTVS